MQPSTDDRSTDADHVRLSGPQLEQLRAALHDIVDEHRRRLSENEELFRSLVTDPSIDVSERQLARQAASTALEICQRANGALQRIEDGTYGRCAACERPIPFERLEALPMTATCVICPEP